MSHEKDFMAEDADEFFLPISISEGQFRLRCEPCTSCGHTDWSGCNVDSDGDIIECDKCSSRDKLN